MKILLINPFGSNWMEGRKDKTTHEEGFFDEKWELMNCLNFVFVPAFMKIKKDFEPN